MLIIAPHVVQTFPEPATRSDLMYIFVKGYLGKKYGVHADEIHSRLHEDFTSVMDVEDVLEDNKRVAAGRRPRTFTLLCVEFLLQ